MTEEKKEVDDDTPHKAPIKSMNESTNDKGEPCSADDGTTAIAKNGASDDTRNQKSLDDGIINYSTHRNNNNNLQSSSSMTISGEEAVGSTSDIGVPNPLAPKTPSNMQAAANDVAGDSNNKNDSAQETSTANPKPREASQPSHPQSPSSTTAIIPPPSAPSAPAETTSTSNPLNDRHEQILSSINHRRKLLDWVRNSRIETEKIREGYNNERSGDGERRTGGGFVREMLDGQRGGGGEEGLQNSTVIQSSAGETTAPSDEIADYQILISMANKKSTSLKRKSSSVVGDNSATTTATAAARELRRGSTVGKRMSAAVGALNSTGMAGGWISSSSDADVTNGGGATMPQHSGQQHPGKQFQQHPGKSFTNSKQQNHHQHKVEKKKRKSTLKNKGGHTPSVPHTAFPHNRHKGATLGGGGPGSGNINHNKQPLLLDPNRMVPSMAAMNLLDRKEGLLKRLDCLVRKQRIRRLDDDEERLGSDKGNAQTMQPPTTGEEPMGEGPTGDKSMSGEEAKHPEGKSSSLLDAHQKQQQQQRPAGVIPSIPPTTVVDGKREGTTSVTSFPKHRTTQSEIPRPIITQQHQHNQQLLHQPKRPPPPRNKTQWDLVLEEMRWLSADFSEERKWKVAACSSLSEAVRRNHIESKKSKRKKKRRGGSGSSPSRSSPARVRIANNTPGSGSRLMSSSSGGATVSSGATTSIDSPSRILSVRHSQYSLEGDAGPLYADVMSKYDLENVRNVCHLLNVGILDRWDCTDTAETTSAGHNERLRKLREGMMTPVSSSDAVKGDMKGDTPDGTDAMDVDDEGESTTANNGGSGVVAGPTEKLPDGTAKELSHDEITKRIESSMEYVNYLKREGVTSNTNDNDMNEQMGGQVELGKCQLQTINVLERLWDEEERVKAAKKIADERLKALKEAANGKIEDKMAEADGDEEATPMVTLPISSGRLGLTLQFSKSHAGAIITAIDPACTFRDRIDVGYKLMTIDGVVINKKEEVIARRDGGGVRMFGFVVNGGKKEQSPKKKEEEVEEKVEEEEGGDDGNGVEGARCVGNIAGIVGGAMGVGKTTAICALLWKGSRRSRNGGSDGHCRSQLIVCSSASLIRWKHELNKFDGLTVKIYGSDDDSTASSSDVIICDYGSFGN